MAKEHKHGPHPNDMEAMILAIQKNFSDCVAGVQEIELEGTGIIKVPPQGQQGDGILHPLPPRRPRRRRSNEV